VRCFEIAPSSFPRRPASSAVEHLDPKGRVGRRLGESGAAEGEVLQREPERLGVGELALQQVERRLQGGQLIVLEIELGEEVGLGAHRVQLLARVLVTLGMQRHAERDQLGPVGIEAARERLVRHLLVALDIPLDVARRDRPPFRHQEGDERELPDQLVGVVRQDPARLAGDACGKLAEASPATPLRGRAGT